MKHLFLTPFKRWAQHCSNQHGVTLITSIAIMITLAVFLSTLAPLRANDVLQSAMHYSKAHTDQLILSGIEYAKHLVNQARDPGVNSINLGSGQFSIIKHIADNRITVESSSGTSHSSRSVDFNFASHCTHLYHGFIPTFTATSGSLSDIHVKKTCFEKIMIEQIMISWTDSLPDQLIDSIVFDGVTVYDDVSIGSPTGGVQSGEVIDIEDIEISDSHQHTFDSINFSYPSGSDPSQPTTFTLTLQLSDQSKREVEYIW